VSGVSGLYNVRRKCAVVVPLAVLAFGSTAAFAAKAKAQSADLATAVTAMGIATTGGYMGYPITVTNNGPDAAANVTLSDQIPGFALLKPPTTFYCVGSVPQPGSRTGWCGPMPPNVSCVTPKVGAPGTVTCTTATLSPRASLGIIIAIHVGFFFHNQAICDTATATSNTFDPNTGNNAATVCSRIN
jgi:hypothetical protein